MTVNCDRSLSLKRVVTVDNADSSIHMLRRRALLPVGNLA